MARGTCSVKGCALPHYGAGFCMAHHRRWLRNGDAKADRPIRRPKAPPRPPFGMPVCGVIAGRPFDPIAARDAAADAAFELAHTPTASARGGRR